MRKSLLELKESLLLMKDKPFLDLLLNVIPIRQILDWLLFGEFISHIPSLSLSLGFSLLRHYVLLKNVLTCLNEAETRS